MASHDFQDYFEKYYFIFRCSSQARNTFVNITKKSSKMRICCFIFSNVIVTTRKGDLKMQKSFLNDWLTRNLQRNNRRLAKMCHLHSLGHTLDKMQKNETFQTKSREETRKRRCTISQMTWVSFLAGTSPMRVTRGLSNGVSGENLFCCKISSTLFIPYFFNYWKS